MHSSRNTVGETPTVATETAAFPIAMTVQDGLWWGLRKNLHSFALPEMNENIHR
jgi:hypothetical protein